MTFLHLRNYSIFLMIMILRIFRAYLFHFFLSCTLLKSQKYPSFWYCLARYHHGLIYASTVFKKESEETEVNHFPLRVSFPRQHSRHSTFLYSFYNTITKMFSRIIIPISNSIFNLMVSLNICSPLSPSTLPTTSSSSLLESEEGVSKFQNPKPLPGSDLAEAERRRAIALKAIDMKLQASAESSTSQVEPVAPTTIIDP
jgi:hypothetical protein